MRKIVFLLVLMLLASCEASKDQVEYLGHNADIIGSWEEVSRKDTISVFHRVNDLEIEEYGFTINEDGTFLERKNSGWCGTPPIVYSVYEGEWKVVSDSVLEITVGFWGGVMVYNMHILSITFDSLRISYESVSTLEETLQ